MPGLGLTTLGACIREGFDKAEKLALRQITRTPRVATHREFTRIQSYLDEAPPVEDLTMAMKRVKSALERANQR